MLCIFIFVHQTFSEKIPFRTFEQQRCRSAGTSTLSGKCLLIRSLGNIINQSRAKFYVYEEVSGAVEAGLIPILKPMPKTGSQFPKQVFNSQGFLTNIVVVG